MGAIDGNEINRAQVGVSVALSMAIPFLQETDEIDLEEFISLAMAAYRIAMERQEENDGRDLERN
jgi:20S proteasome alpha/beta subunit